MTQHERPDFIPAPLVDPTQDEQVSAYEEWVSTRQYQVRLWEQPRNGYKYALGVDPAEGLVHGDDSVIQVGCANTGRQVCEIQGKIPPLDLAELAYLVGTYYNTALVGGENNKDGGFNHRLGSASELRYPYVYFQTDDTQQGWFKVGPKLGFNMHERRRAQLIASARRRLEDGENEIRSQWLLAQMEVFGLFGNKFQAPRGAHDDLVMAWLICSEMMAVQYLREAAADPLPPLVDGVPVDGPFREDWDTLENERALRLEARIQKQLKARERDEPLYASTAEGMV